MPVSPWHGCGQKSASAASDRESAAGHPGADTSLTETRGYSNSELQFQFIGNALLTPRRILSAHLPDQLTKIPGEARAADRLRLPAPEQPKPSSVPADERIRFDIHQRIAPAEHPTQGCHHPTRGIVGSSRFDSPLL